MSVFVQFFRIVVTVDVILFFWMFKIYDLAGLVPPLWHLGEPLDDPGALGTTRNETLQLRLGFSSISKFFDFWTK